MMLRFLLQHRIRSQFKQPFSPKQSQIQTWIPNHLLRFLHNSIPQNPPLSNNQNPDSFTSLLKSYDFTPTQISTIISKYPQFLTSKLETTIKPKLDFLLSVGFVPTDLTTIISSRPMLLRSSLNNRLRPNLIILTSIFLSLQQIAVAIHRNARLLQVNLETNLLPNVRTLQSYGIPETNIAKLVRGYPRVIMLPNEQLKMVVESIKKMGFDPKSTMFVHGVRVMCGMSTSKWEGKVAMFKSLGFSEEDINTLFTKQPFCMQSSEEKIKKAVDFFVKKLQWEPSRVMVNPVILNLSLEKRVMPRWSVMSVLASRGLVTLNSSVWFLLMSENNFVKEYVIKYQDQVPEVLKVYNGDLVLEGVEGESKIAIIT